MSRLTALFVAVCSVLISASVGATLYMMFGLSGAESAVVGVAVLTALGLYTAITGRGRERSDVSMQIADLSRGTGDLARQVAELGRRVVTVEAKLDSAVDKAMAATEPLANEIGELGLLVTRLAESVAAHDTAASRQIQATMFVTPSSPSASSAFASPPSTAPHAEALAYGAPTVQYTPPAPPASPSPPAAPAVKVAPDVRSDSVLELNEPVPPPFKGMDRKAILEMLARAIEANRVDLYLQPIVTLPQRKVRYYEAMSRLKTDDGEVVPASAFLEYAESSGLMPKLDNLLLFRCVQVLRRLLLKNRDIGLFCNISAPTLTSQIYPQLLEFLEANKALGPSLVFEFTQAAYRAMGPMEQESMAALAERGFRFSMDNLTDLRFEPRDLSERGFRFIKAPGALLLNQATAATSNIHPADMSDLLGRFGIDLIADKIEGETMVVDLLDYDVRFGQGFLFSPPRPVRAEALQGITERNDVVARDAPMADEARRDPPSDGRPAGSGQRTGGIAALARGVVVRNG
jgi:cyclic-di-GMP phosphodiesterase TipF (flagellum assembly factor)